MNEVWDLSILYKDFDDPAFTGDMKALDEAIAAANEIASEHLEIVTKDPFQVMTKIKNAGAIFIGENSSEPHR